MKRTICGTVCVGEIIMTDKFFQRYEMKVHPSRRKLRRMKRPDARVNPWDTHISDVMLHTYYLNAVEEVDCVDIVMPADRLKELEEILEWHEQYEHKIKYSGDVAKYLLEDKRVRIENPAVAKAYEKYIMLLELARK